MLLTAEECKKHESTPFEEIDPAIVCVSGGCVNVEKQSAECDRSLCHSRAS